MDAKTCRGLMEAYEEVHAPKEETILEDIIIELCNQFGAFETLDERAEFAVDVVESDTVIEFLTLLSEECDIDVAEILSESYENLDENLKGKALRYALNALPSSARKKILKTVLPSALGKTGNTLRGSAASVTVRNARGARDLAKGAPRPPGLPLAAAKAKKAADVSGATRQLPSAGGTSAGSIKAKIQRGNTRDQMAKNQVTTFVQGLKQMIAPTSSVTKKVTSKITTPKSTGGLLGTRTIKTPGAGLPRQAPKPEFGSGSGSGSGYPKLPKTLPGRIVAPPSGAPQTPPGRIVASPGGAAKVQSIKKVSVKDLGPTAKNTVSKGGKTLSGDGVTDVSATTVSSRRTLKSYLQQIARNKKALTATAIGVGAGAGLLSGTEKTADTSPAVPPKSSVANIDPQTKSSKKDGPTEAQMKQKAAEQQKETQKQMKDDPRTETPETPETPKTSETPKATETPKAPKAPVIKQTGNKEKDESEWEKANPRLAAVAKMRKAGASREEINKVLYNKGTKAYGAK